MLLDLKINEINRIEKSNTSVFEFDHINWWPLIRIYLFQKHKQTQTFDKRSLIYPKRVLLEFKMWREYRKKFKSTHPEQYQRLTPVDTLFLTSDTNYKKDVYGNLINRYLDPLYLNEAGSKCIVVRSHKKNSAYTIPELLSVEYFDLKLKLDKQVICIMNALFFLPDKATYAQTHQAEINKIVSHVRSFSFFKEFDFSQLPKWFNQVAQAREVAQCMFNQLKPKRFVQYCYYFPVQFGYTLAANSMNIVSADYQHGIQNKFHYGYGSWVNVPDKGYQLLPKEFLVFSDREKENLLTGFAQSTHLVKVIGNKWIEYWKKNRTKKEDLLWLDKIKNKGHQIILYTVSNYLIDKGHFFWEYLKDTKPETFYFLFRLHPGHMHIKETLELRLKETGFHNYNIEDASKIELYDLLDECDLHITQNSTVAEEALYFNKKTIIVDDNWRQYFQSYIEKKEMFLATSQYELQNFITSN